MTLRSQLLPAVATLFLYILAFALFLLPGLAVTAELFRRRSTSAFLLVISIVVASATLGVFSFWMFFFSKTFGRYASYGIYIVSLVYLLLPAWSKNGRLPALFRLVKTPFLYVAVAGLLYTCFLFVFSNPLAAKADLPNSRFFEESRPGDNLIPLFLADRLYDQRPLRPFCCEGWLSSDRPPLQSGIFLLERPLRVPAGSGLYFQLLGTSLQCLWICGVWCLLVALGTSPLRVRQALGFLIVSGFLFYNSVYTWPKLLACAFLLFLFAIIVDLIRNGRRLTTVDTCLASVSLSLALLAHPGGVFSLPAFVFVAFRYRHLIPFRHVGLGALIVAGFTLPWIAYQHFVDPPGDRLLKMHLGGETELTTRSTWQVVRDAYAHYPAVQILRFKASNLALLLGRKPFDAFGMNSIVLGPQTHIERTITEQSRTAQREYIWNALGFLNAGWVAAIASRWRRRQSSPVPFASWLVPAAIVNLAIWSLVIFGPGATVTTHSSYADILLLSIGLISWILTLPKLLTLLLFVLESFNLLVVWVWSFPQVQTQSVLQIPMALFGLVGIVLLGYYFGKSYWANEH